MKFGNKNMKIGIVAVLIVIVASISLYSYSNRGTIDRWPYSGETYLFIKPAFAQSMSTAPTFLDDEAGISLYVNINRPIDLTVAKTVYRTLEKETLNYTVGSIALPGLSSNEDVHCFVHKDGWIVTYYLKGEPISKIVDWNLWSQSTSKLNKNKLQVGLEQMTNSLGVVATGVKYYHFQYPNSNKCMIIIKGLVGSGENSFNVTIPDDIEVDERSWSHYSEYLYYGYNSYFKIDGNTINTIAGSGSVWNVTIRGTLSVAQLFPSVPHVVGVSSNYGASYQYGVCLALAYQEPL